MTGWPVFSLNRCYNSARFDSDFPCTTSDWIRENAAAFDAALARRGLPGEADKLIAIDERRRAAILKFEQAQARRNAASKEIGQAKAKKDEATAQQADGRGQRAEGQRCRRSKRRRRRPKRS